MMCDTPIFVAQLQEIWTSPRLDAHKGAEERPEEYKKAMDGHYPLEDVDFDGNPGSAVMLALRFVQNTVKLFSHCLWAMLDIGICLPMRWKWVPVVDITIVSRKSCLVVDSVKSKSSSVGPWNTTCSLDFGGLH